MYDTIYCDPPWTYRDRASAGARGVAHKYPLLDLCALKALPIDRIAKPDCALMMWATCPLLPDAIELMGAWGFEYKTVAFIWIKTHESKKITWGMGNWSRANAELVLLGTRGKPARASAGVHQVIAAPRESPHSRKPEAVRYAIEALIEGDARVELFATRQVPGWVCTGYGADGRDIRDFLGVGDEG
jgi:N6-adenosine-specific RNA methylase IME4